MPKTQDSQEKAKRSYFRPLAGRKPAIIGAVVIVLALALGSQLGGASMIVLLVGLAVAAFGVLRIAMTSSKPTDEQMDEWLRAALQQAERDAHQKLGFEPQGSGPRDRNTVRANPTTVYGPIMWVTRGIPNDDLVGKAGKDKLARFGVYRITVILLTDSQLGAYSCDFNFLKNVRLNEQTDEYHYVDVVSVSTRETATNYTLKTGTKLTVAEEFRVSVSSGESVSVMISSADLKEITGAERLPDSGAEQAIRAIRGMLRDKKAPQPMHVPVPGGELV